MTGDGAKTWTVNKKSLVEVRRKSGKCWIFSEFVCLGVFLARHDGQKY